MLERESAPVPKPHADPVRAFVRGCRAKAEGPRYWGPGDVRPPKFAPAGFFDIASDTKTRDWVSRLLEPNP